MTQLTDVEAAFAYGDSLLVGRRVRLRGLRDDDLPALARWEADPGRLATVMNWVVPPSEAHARDALARWCANDKDDVGFCIESVAEPATLLGMVHLQGARAKDRSATLGIALGREHLHRGYGTDAVRVVLAYAFREMGLHRVELWVADFNGPGQRAYRNAGFVEEGRRRQAVWHDGAWYDEILMSVLDDEWAQRAVD